MIHQRNGDVIHVHMPEKEVPAAKGFPKKGHVQVDFSISGYCLRIIPAGINGRPRKMLENRARKYLKQEGFFS